MHELWRLHSNGSSVETQIYPLGHQPLALCLDFPVTPWKAFITFLFSERIVSQGHILPFI